MKDLITTASVLPETLERAQALVSDISARYSLRYIDDQPDLATPAKYDDAVNRALPDIKRLQKELEAFRKAFKKPFDDAAKRIQAFFSGPAEHLAYHETALKRAIAAHIAVEEAKRKAYEAELNAKEQLKAELFETEARVMKVPEVVTGGAVSRRTIVKWRIVDEAAIPRQYLQVDEKKLNQIARWGGQTKIPGVEFYEEEILAARASKPEPAGEVIDSNA